jgi:hypothetical protein
LIAASMLAGCGAGEPPAPAAGPLPENGFLGVWNLDGDRSVFPGAELYGHINGGAEVFLELGFEELVVQRYVSESGEIAVELYRMSDPVAALGIYLMKCGVESPDPSLEARHTVGPTQLQMVRGDAYVSVNAMRSDSDLEPALIGFARHLTELLPEGETGGVFADLPTAGRVAGSERIIRGPYTLEAMYTLGDGDILGLAGTVTAVAAQFDGGSGRTSALISVPYADEATADHAFRNLVENLDPYLEVLATEPQRLVFSDYSDHFGEVVREGARLRIRVHLVERPE